MRQSFYNDQYGQKGKPNKSFLDRLRVPQLNTKDSLQLIENGVGRIYQVLKYIEKSGPYIEKYGPIIKEVPTMYKVMKAINELEHNKEGPTDSTEDSFDEIDKSRPKQSKPKLYI